MNSSPRLKSALEEISRNTWNLLRSAKDYGGLIGEETLTDLLAIKMRQRQFPVFAVKQVAKPEEGKIGADIEILVGSDTFGWCRLVVQAKKLNTRSMKYEMLADARALPQLRKLENYAGNDAIPMYLLYNYVDSPNRDSWRCHNSRFNRWQLGCTLTPSNTIWQMINTRDFTFGHAHQHYLGTIPLRCLSVCSKDCVVDETLDCDRLIPSHYNSLSSLFHVNLRNLLLENFDGIVDANQLNPDYYNEDRGFPRLFWILDTSLDDEEAAARPTLT